MYAQQQDRSRRCRFQLRPRTARPSATTRVTTFGIPVKYGDPGWEPSPAHTAATRGARKNIVPCDVIQSNRTWLTMPATYAAAQSAAEPRAAGRQPREQGDPGRRRTARSRTGVRDAPGGSADSPWSPPIGEPVAREEERVEIRETSRRSAATLETTAAAAPAREPALRPRRAPREAVGQGVHG